MLKKTVHSQGEWIVFYVPYNGLLVYVNEKLRLLLDNPNPHLETSVKEVIKWMKMRHWAIKVV